jgi:pectin methylesterase-like acyl-CoA thioesterase
MAGNQRHLDSGRFAAVLLVLVLATGGVASAATVLQCSHDQRMQATCCHDALSHSGAAGGACCCDVAVRAVSMATEAATNQANQLIASGAPALASWSPVTIAAGGERWIGARGSGADPVPILLLTKSFLI